MQNFQEYNCFGCSPTNPSGLRMEFYEEGDEIVCRWNPGEHYQGFHDILHGGIQATMMDEIASWVVFVKLDTAGVTYRIEYPFSKACLDFQRCQLPSGQNLIQQKRSIATIEVSSDGWEGKLCSESQVDYFVLAS